MNKFDDVKDELETMLNSKPPSSPVEAISRAFLLENKLLFAACSELAKINGQLELIRFQLSKINHG
jgi:hypothetical protein